MVEEKKNIDGEEEEKRRRNWLRGRNSCSLSQSRSRDWLQRSSETSFLPFQTISWRSFFWRKHFYRNRVRSLGMLVTNSLTDWLTNSVTFSKLDWCDPGVWRCQLKTCWGCFCCGCWSWESCWQLLLQIWGLRFDHKAKEILSWSQTRFWCWSYYFVADNL